MRVCQIVAGGFSQQGGLEKHYIDQCNLLARQPDCRLTAIGHAGYAPYLHQDVDFIPMDLERGRFNVLRLLQLLRILRQLNFDIVHTQANKATAMVGMLRPFFSASHVATLHGLKKSVSMYRRANHVICVSARIAEKVDNPNISVIYNGTDTSVVDCEVGYLQREFALPHDSIVVVSVGRLVHAKGFDLLLKAFSGLNAFLLIVGDGPDKEKLQTLASSLKLHKQAVFAGFRTDVRKILKHADLAVIASRREGFSYVMAEVLLSRCPLISTDVADIRAIVGDQYCVMPGDVEGLREKIKLALPNLDEMRKNFSASFAFANQEFSVETMVQKTLSTYNAVLQR